jgi:hypothetical protein
MTTPQPVVDERVDDPVAKAGWCAAIIALIAMGAVHVWVFGYWVAVAIPFTLFPTLVIAGLCGLLAAYWADRLQPQHIPHLNA